MNRPDRWWRPSTTRRPAQRARQRRVYTVDDVADGFELGYRAGQVDDTTGDQRDQYEQLRRLADAADAAEQGDMGPLDDFLGVADAAGVAPLGDVDGGQLVDELEAWLRDQD